MYNLTHVEGKDKGKIVLYGLTTCAWCKKTKALLDELGVDYYYVFLDSLSQPDKEMAVDDVNIWNPMCSFPTLVLKDSKCIIGFKEEEIKQELG
ncbi:MAG: glutaredoxin family protein [Spirochaetota bacterium]